MLDKWCSRLWLYVMYALGTVSLVLSIVCWAGWSFGQRLIGSLCVILPIHVYEEWQFPGGFHYQYNLLMKSSVPDRYPMSRLTDMITNFFGELFFLLLLVLKMDGTGVILSLTVFCWLEAVIHTVVGIVMLRKLRSKGKRTIYGPGTASALLLFLPAGTLGLLELMKQSISGSDVLCALTILGITLIGLILLPETLLKRKDSPYAFANAGYFERFLH